MTAPAAVLAAIARVSHTVSCWPCGGTVGVSYDSHMDTIVVRHTVRHPLDDPAARALGELVTDLLAELVALADYGPDPVHIAVPA